MFRRLLIGAIACVCIPDSVFAQSDGAPPFAVAPDPVSFSNGDVKLAGALLKPVGQGPFPAVVIVHGAGPATMDEPAFRVHANAFREGGFIVLLYDKRGSGASTGVLDTADYDDLAGDLAAGIKFLRSRSDIIPSKIGVLGRSEGGWIGALAASHDPIIAFVIMSSGSAVRPYDEALFATGTALTRLGASAEEVKAATNAKAALWAYYKKVAAAAAGASQSAALKQERDALQSRLQSFARFAPQIPQVVRDPSTTPVEFFRAFTAKMDFDPARSLAASQAAILEVIGADDNVVEPASTVAAFDRLRQQGRDVTVQVLPGVDHSLVIMTNQGPRYPDDYPEFTVRWARARIDHADK